MGEKIQFNAALNNSEFMTGAREINRAINSLKTTVVQVGKSMNSAASGYGVAMRQSVKAGREFSTSVNDIKSRIEELRSSTSGIKAAADKFRDVKQKIDDANESIKNMETEMQDLIASGGKYSSAWTNNQSAIAKTNAEIEKYTKNAELYRGAAEKAMERLNSGTTEDGRALTKQERASYSKDANYNIDIYNRIGDKIDGLNDKLAQYEQEQARLISEGENLPLSEYTELQDRIDQARSALEPMNKELAAMKKDGYENADKSDEYLRQVEQLDRLTSALENVESVKERALKPPYMQSWENMTRLSGMLSEGFGRIENAASGALYAITHPVEAVDRALGTIITKTGQAVSSFARMAGSGAVSFLKRLASEAGNAAIQLAKLAANAVTSGFKKIASGAAAAAKGVLNFGRAHRSSNSGLKTGLKTILKYAFGVRSMFFLFRRLRAAVTDAFNQMAQSSPELKASINGLQAALNGLKGSLATAFAPIFTAIAPALTYLINMLTAAMNTIGAFFAAFTGKSTFKAAAGGMKATGKSAGGASKKVKELKRELAGFDELNILNDNKNDSGGGGGGGGGGSGLTYKTQQISDGIKNFVKEIKDLWDSGEYKKIGLLLGKHINKAINKAYNAVKWENLKKKWTKAIDAFTGIFNGLIKGIDWNLIGKTISEGVNTLVQAADYLVSHIDFAAAGRALATGLNGLFSNPNLFADAWGVFKKTIKGVLNFADVFLEKFNEAQLAADIRKVFEDGPSGGWESIASSAWDVIKKAFNKAGNFANVLLGGDPYAGANPDLQKYARKRPQNVAPSFTVDSSIWDELAENLANGINGAVEKATNIINGLKTGDAVFALSGWITKVRNGIHWDVVGNFFGASFKTMLDGIGAIIDSWAGEAETIGGQIADAINGFVDTAFDGDAIATHFNNAVKGAFSFITGFVEKLDEEKSATELKKAIEGVDWKGIAETAWKAFKTAVSKLGNFLTILFDGDVKVDPVAAVGEAVRAGKSVQEAIQQATKDANGGGLDLSAEGLAKSVGGAVTAMLDKLNAWIKNINWADVGAGLKEFLTNLPWSDWATQLAQALTDLFDSIREFFAGLIFGADGGKKFAAWQKGEMTYGGTQYKKAQTGEVSQEFYDTYAKLSEQARKYVENMLNAGAFTLDIGQALDITGWDELTSEMQYAYFLALQDSFGGEKTFGYLKKHGKEVTDALAEGIKAGDINVEEDGENAVLTFADGTKTQLEKSSEELQGLFETLGVDSVAGMVEAFNNDTTADEAINEEMLGVVETANNAVETGSPSKVFEELGVNIVDGLILGLQTLPQALQGVWQGLPQWAQALLGNAAGEFKLAVSGGVGGNGGGGASTADTSDNTKATKRQTKDTRKLTKEIRKNTKARPEVNVNYEGAGFNTSGDKPTLTVGVNFAPNGEEPSEDNTNGGLLGWLQELLGAETVEAKVALIKEGWENFKGWLSDNGLNENSPIGQLIDLVKNNFDTVMGFLGIDPNSPIGTFLKLILDNADNLLAFLGIDRNTPISTMIKLVLEKFKDIMDFLGIPNDSPIRAFVDLLMGKTDPEIDKAFSQDGSTIQTFIELAKKGFTTFLGFLGIDTTNPLIKTIVNLLLGETDDEARNVLDAKDGEVDKSVNLKLGKEDSEIKTALDGSDKTKPIKLTDSTSSSGVTKEAINGNEKTKPIKLTDSASSSSVTKTAIDGAEKSKSIKLTDSASSSSVTKTAINGQETSKTIKLNDSASSSSVTKTAINGSETSKTIKLVDSSNSSSTVKESVNGSSKDKTIKLVNSSNSSGTVKESVNGSSKDKTIKLVNSSKSSTTVSNALNGQAVTKKVTLSLGSVASTLKSALKKIGIKLASGGIVRNGGSFKRFASGGIISGGVARYLSNIPHYASGTTRARGTVFVAGEAGPEIMGHINGRTEILNKSQIADAIYSAVVSGMGAAVNALGTYLANHMTNCTNSIVQTIGANSVAAQMGSLDYYAPSMVTSGVVPYDVSMQIARSTEALQSTLNENNEELIQAMVSAMGNAAQSIVQVLQRQIMQSQANGRGYSTQQAVNDINRSTLMFGASPLKGV